MQLSSSETLLLRVGWILLLALLYPSALWAQFSAEVPHMNLAQLVERAGIIVQGQILSARVETHPQFQNLQTVVVTIRVKHVWKGPTTENVRFRQWVFDGSDLRERLGYRVGQEYLLLLNSPSRYGLTSPVGLEQGRFRIFRGSGDLLLAVNGWGNRNLSDGMQKRFGKSTGSQDLSSAFTHQPGGPQPLEGLTGMIENLLAAYRP